MHIARAALMLGWTTMLSCQPADDDPASTPEPPPATGGETEASSEDSGTDEFIPDPAWERWEVRAPGYTVPIADTTYVCFGLTVTVTEPTHIVAFAPVIDQVAVVHHMILLRSEEPLDQIEPCYPGPPSSFMQWGWGPGGGPLALPPEAGFPVGQQPGLVHLVLQVHYDNAAGREGVVDRSGIDVYTTTELRPQDAGIFSVGDVASLVIPPGQERWPTTFWCGSESTAAIFPEPIDVFGSWLHAHRLGRSLWTDHLRDDVVIGELGRHDPYDFDNQRFEPLQATIEPGDALRTRCDYDSRDQTEPVHGGGGTNDEMCLNYLMYHPAQPWLGQCNDG